MKIRIFDIQVGDRVFDAGSRTYVEVVQKTLHSKGVTITFADMPDTPLTVGGLLTVEVQRADHMRKACEQTIAELEAAGVVITGKHLLDGMLQPKPELDAADRVMRAEAELNAAIRELPPNMYAKATVIEYPTKGRTYPMPIVTVTPCQEA